MSRPGPFEPEPHPDQDCAELLHRRLPRSGAGLEEALTYDPGEAVRREIEGEDRTESLAERFDRHAEEDMRRARDEPLPAIVAAYRDVFGSLPEGWPHPEM